MNTSGGKDGVRSRIYQPRLGRWIVHRRVDVPFSTKCSTISSSARNLIPDHSLRPLLGDVHSHVRQDIRALDGEPRSSNIIFQWSCLHIWLHYKFARLPLSCQKARMQYAARRRSVRVTAAVRVREACLDPMNLLYICVITVNEERRESGRRRRRRRRRQSQCVRSQYPDLSATILSNGLATQRRPLNRC